MNPEEQVERREPSFTFNLKEIAREIASTSEARDFYGDWLHNSDLFQKKKRNLDEKLKQHKKAFDINTLDINDRPDAIDTIAHDSALHLDENDIAFLILTDHSIFDDQEGKAAWTDVEKRDLLDAVLTKDILSLRRETALIQRAGVYYRYLSDQQGATDIEKNIRINDQWQQKLRARRL